MKPHLMPILRTFSFLVCSATALMSLALASPARADSTEDCQLYSSQQRVDYGRITTDSLQDTLPAIGAKASSGGQGSLMERTLTITVNCKTATHLRLFFDSMSSQGTQFLFGNKGTMMVEISQAQMDSQSVRMVKLRRGGAALGAGRALVHVKPEEGIAFVNQGEVKGMALSLQMRIRPDVAIKDVTARDKKVLGGNIRIALETVSLTPEGAAQ
ncbi:hypothetical protein I6H07_22915 (plasmid) [Hafnia alvei]|uniref:hypothetical protein n=1 Tax=Hafnia alvei TaxID=569 RepID=UPI000B6D85E2|nr:hypothetical protein [Hafnia alvei]MBI0278588.1 hypothetical protein [Hafnia alvei]PNL03884.1 hypothetical protein CEQ28_000310 [Hafnia alvei]